MRKLLMLMSGIAALAGASSANAAVVFKTEINQPALTLTNSSNFGAILDDVFAPFSITFDFLVTGNMFASSSVTTQMNSLNDIDFTSVLLDGFLFTQGGADPQDETFFLTLAGPLSLGLHTITVNGVTGASGDGAFGGNLSLSAAVPEPATWMMMLLGFAGVGFAVRKSRKPFLAQLA